MRAPTWRDARRTVLRAAAALAALVAASTSATAAAGVDAAPRLVPTMRGYAFDTPRILAQQMIFGRAHAVTLLMRACSGQPAGEPGAATTSAAALAAYDEWMQRYAVRLRQSEAELARFYFGADAGRATATDIAAALGLAESLDTRAPAAVVTDACATLPAALATKRHNLDLIFALHVDEARLVTGVEVEARVAACLADKAPARDAARQQVETAAVAWRQRYGDMIEAASARRRHFRGETAAQWARWRQMIAEAARKQHGGSAAECDALPEFLQSAAASPAAAFREDPEHVGSTQ